MEDAVIALLLAAIALAAPKPVVALGDGLVAGNPAVESPAGPGGWVAALADCLEERQPGQWTVVDRTVPGDTAATALARVDAVQELSPGLVVVSVGARELADSQADPEGFRLQLGELVDALHAQEALPIMLVGMVPPTMDQLGSRAGDQELVDARTTTWNQILAQVAESTPSATHLDLWTQWPRQGADRSALTVDGVHLSDQGHARVAAAVCDAVLSR